MDIFFPFTAVLGPKYPGIVSDGRLSWGRRQRGRQGCRLSQGGAAVYPL